ncbi:MAG: transposase, partial [Alphaproteobacteria bacterium]|nr:transposase [Alphaproteobacteria bacterium]
MARLGRYFIKDQPQHVIQRGIDRRAVFFTDADYEHYRDWLIDAAGENGTRVHAYVLMANHVHMLVTPERADSLPRTMQSLGRRYVRYVNFSHKRTGTMWEGRYRAAPIDSNDYFLMCCRYIELNPVRARVAAHPRDYPWSSYRAHALGAPDPLISDHPNFRALGRSLAERQKSYRALFRNKLDEDFIDALRSATNGGWALGDDRFKRQIAKAAKRRASPLPTGRPPNSAKDKRLKQKG